MHGETVKFIRLPFNQHRAYDGKCNTSHQVPGIVFCD